jgi:hypothetical protein
MLRRAAFGLSRAIRPLSTMLSPTPMEDAIREKVVLFSFPFWGAQMRIS